MKVCVLGSGAWGTALGCVLHQEEHRVVMWGRNPELLAAMRRTRLNERYLPGIELPETWDYEADLGRALAGVDGAILAVPSSAVRALVAQMGGYGGMLVSVTKGIDYVTGLTMCGLMEAGLPGARVAALSGPSLALEVARGVPTAVVAASRHPEVAQAVQGLFHRPAFRVYTSADLVGVELGGALKNVGAIAAGVGDGLGFGDNTKASLLTRAIAEIRRLGVACGALAETFSGLSGLGDLTVTCFSRLSRNRLLGERLGRGEELKRVLATSTGVPEGYPTARSAVRLARERGVSTPIIDEVYAILYEGKDPARAVRDLTNREQKAED